MEPKKEREGILREGSAVPSIYKTEEMGGSTPWLTSYHYVLERRIL